MGLEMQARCHQNQPLVQELLLKHDELLDTNRTLAHAIKKAASSLCQEADALKSPTEFLRLKYCGKTMLKFVKCFLVNEEQPTSSKADKSSTGGSKAYIPQENSAPYAILISLFRASQSGKEFLTKEETIEEAESSGLCRTNIRPESRGSHAPNGGRENMYYCGWSSMGKLVNRGLVVKWGRLTKYALTELGFKTAVECMVRSGRVTAGENFVWTPPRCLDEMATHDLSKNGAKRRKKMVEEEEVENAHCQEVEEWSEEEVPFCREGNRDAPINLDTPVKHPSIHEDSQPQIAVEEQLVQKNDSEASAALPLPSSHQLYANPPSRQPFPFPVPPKNRLRVPPLQCGEKFSDVYDLILCIDSREVFAKSRSCNGLVHEFVDRLKKIHGVASMVRGLAVGDALWIARRKEEPMREYVLDFIVERKQVDDMWQSIIGKRFNDQKLRLKGCGLKKVIYLVEGDPDKHTRAQNIKTGMLKTEIEEGFDVQRTSHWQGEDSTLDKYAHLTAAISRRYADEVGGNVGTEHLCPTFEEFQLQCKEDNRSSTFDVFGAMLSQIRHVTEPVALSIMEKYPTLIHLAEAYKELEGDLQAQETLLTSLSVNSKQISNLISKRVFETIWK